MLRRTFLATPLALYAAERPNVVLIVADDLGSADLSSYGASDIRTPNIDSLGRDGVRFTQFYANGPECSPTRSALMTGRYQQRAGGLECAIGLGDVGRYDDAIWLQKRGELGLPSEEFTMPRAFKTAGYETACFGKWHLGYPRQFWPDRHGFDESFGVLGGGANYYTHVEPEPNGKPYVYRNGKLAAQKGYLTDLFADHAIQWLSRRKQKPYFLYLPFTAPHTPIQGPGAEAEVRTRATYAQMVEHMDKRIGDVLAAVNPKNTLVVFISDNGADPNGSNGTLRGRKSSLFEGGIRIPCLMRWPGRIKSGAEVSQAALTMDLLPTFAAAAGLRLPAGRKLDGADLLPAIDGKPLPERSLYWRFKRADRVRKAARTGAWKYIRDGGDEFLFHLANDPLEKSNLIGSHGDRAGELRSRLAAWERDVMAPRLKPIRSEPG